AVRFEHHREALGIGEARPRVSWKAATDAEAWVQTAYEIEVADPDGGEAAASTTGRVASAECVLVDWPAAPLRSRERRSVRVRVWGPGGSEPSPWSGPAWVEAGLLEPADWTARLVAP